MIKLPPTYDSEVHPEHPDDEPEIVNSDRVAKSATPKYTLDWYVKWFASALILTAVSLRAAEIPEFHIIDLWLSWTGCVLWLWVALIWRDRSLMLLNAVAGFILAVGILKHYYEEPALEPVEIVEYEPFHRGGE